MSKEYTIQAIEAKLKTLENKSDDFEVNKTSTNEVPLIQRYQYNKNAEKQGGPQNNKYSMTRGKYSSAPYNRRQRHPRRWDVEQRQRSQLTVPVGTSGGLIYSIWLNLQLVFGIIHIVLFFNVSAFSGGKTPIFYKISACEKYFLIIKTEIFRFIFPYERIIFNLLLFF